MASVASGASYFNEVAELLYFRTGKINWLLLIRYPFFIVNIPLKLLVSAILNVTNSLLVNTKSN